LAAVTSLSGADGAEVKTSIWPVTHLQLPLAGPFQLPAQQSGTLSWSLSGTRPPVQTVSPFTCVLKTYLFARY